MKWSSQGQGGEHRTGPDTAKPGVISTALCWEPECTPSSPLPSDVWERVALPEHHLQHAVGNERHYHQRFLLDLPALVSGQLTLDGGSASAWLEWGCAGGAQSSGCSAGAAGSWCAAPPPGSCSALQERSFSWGLA